MSQQSALAEAIQFIERVDAAGDACVEAVSRDDKTWWGLHEKRVALVEQFNLDAPRLLRRVVEELQKREVTTDKPSMDPVV